MNIEEINETITELENGETTYDSCMKLASLYTVRNNFQVDFVENSTVDENINELLKLFISYYNDMSIETQKPLLATLGNIVLELSQLCSNSEQKSVFKNFIMNVSKIAT